MAFTTTVEVQETFVMIKPAAMDNYQEIMAMINNLGLRIWMKPIELNNDQINELYQQHIQQDWFHDVRNNLIGQNVMVMIICGENAVAKIIDLAGPTNPDGNHNTIRGRYGRNLTDNGFHRSDCEESAEREIKIFFPNRNNK